MVAEFLFWNSVTLFKWGSPDSLAQFYYPAVIVVSSLLVSSLRVFGVAVIASAAGVFVLFQRYIVHGISMTGMHGS